MNGIYISDHLQVNITLLTFIYHYSTHFYVPLLYSNQPICNTLTRLTHTHHPIKASICSSLDFSNAPSVPDAGTFLKKPSNSDATVPSKADLESKYLFGGEPAVIKGATLYEL